MKQNQIDNLAFHLSQITYHLINQIDEDGIISTLFKPDTVAPDIVASHHLLELLNELGESHFQYEIGRIINWMRNPKNGYLDHPFVIDPITSIYSKDIAIGKYLRETIIKTQLPDGSFTQFTAYLGGGDYFSTLWCVKILLNDVRHEFTEEIDKAINYLIDKRAIAAKKMNHKGFLALVLAKADCVKYEALISELTGQLYADVAGLDIRKLQPHDLLSALYVYEDIIRCSTSNDRANRIQTIKEAFTKLFELDKKDQKLPRAVKEVFRVSQEGLSYQILSRACLVGQLICLDEGYSDLPINVNTLLHSHYHSERANNITLEYSLKKYISTYGKMHEKFSVYDKILKEYYDRTGVTFDRSVFIMMPFSSNERYVKVAEIIKEVCRKHNFTAVRTDDLGRSLSPQAQLWENLVINMLSCKYAIAIVVSEKAFDAATSKPITIQNPNVALEYGFFASRGQEVLLLKDKSTTIYADLMGTLFEEFDITMPGNTLVEPLEKWLRKIEGEAKPK